MKIGVFDLGIMPVGHSEFNAILSYKQGILFNWGNFETREAAISSAIQSCKKIFGVAFDAANKPGFRVKSKIVDAVQWFPELKIEGVYHIDLRGYIYCGFQITPGDWIVNGKVVTNEVFKEKYECIKDLLLH